MQRNVCTVIFIVGEEFCLEVGRLSWIACLKLGKDACKFYPHLNVSELCS